MPVRRLFHLFMPIFALFTVYLGAQTESSAAGSIVPGRYIVVYRSATVPGDAEARTRALGAHVLQRHDRVGIATVQSLHIHPQSPTSKALEQSGDDREVMRQLASQPNVEYVLHDRIVTSHHLRVRAVSVETDTIFAVATGPAAFDTYYNSPQGWAVRQAGGYGNGIPGGPATGPWNTTTGQGVRIAIIDSGVDASHTDLAPNLALNLSEVDQSVLPSICDDGSPRDQAGHGTWTASLAAAALGPGTGRVVGVAPSATILNIKASSVCLLPLVAEQIRPAARRANQAGF